MPLICGCFREEQVIPVKEEKEDVTDLKVIAKIAQFPDVRQMKKKNKNQEEDNDSIIGKEMDEAAKVPTSIDTTPSSNVSSYSMEHVMTQIKRIKSKL